MEPRDTAVRPGLARAPVEREALRMESLRTNFERDGFVVLERAIEHEAVPV